MNTISDAGVSDGKPTNPADGLKALTRAPLGLCPDTMPAAAAIAFLEGAHKYGRFNWRVLGVRASVYHDALRRHMMQWWGGEDIDKDSGLPHLWKMAACVAILLDAEVVGKLNDDRPPKAPMTALLKGMESKVAALGEAYKDKKTRQFDIND